MLRQPTAPQLVQSGYWTHPKRDEIDTSPVEDSQSPKPPQPARVLLRIKRIKEPS